MKNKNVSIQEWIPIEKIEDDGILKLKNNKIVKIMKVIPINFNLKSDLEKNSILNSYKVFLKTCNFNFQILIQSNKKDLSTNIRKIRKNYQKKEEQFLKDIAEEYIKFIKNINLNQKSTSKIFYIIISSEKIQNNNLEIVKEELNEQFLKINECLSRCGNYVEKIDSKEELFQIIYSFYNTKKYLKNK